MLRQPRDRSDVGNGQGSESSMALRRHNIHARIDKKRQATEAEGYEQNSNYAWCRIDKIPSDT